MLVHLHTNTDIQTPVVASPVLRVRRGLVARSAAGFARGNGIVPVDLVLVVFLGRLDRRPCVHGGGMAVGGVVAVGRAGAAVPAVACDGCFGTPEVLLAVGLVEELLD